MCGEGGPFLRCWPPRPQEWEAGVIVVFEERPTESQPSALLCHSWGQAWKGGLSSGGPEGSTPTNHLPSRGRTQGAG